MANGNIAEVTYLQGAVGCLKLADHPKINNLYLLPITILSIKKLWK